METFILKKQLAAVALFAGNKDIRYYLNGVNVETSPTETRIAATDGHTAAVCRTAFPNAERLDVIIPIAIVALALKMNLNEIHLQCDTNNYWSLAGIRFEPVEGRFPDYRRIIPSKCSGEAASFNPEYIARCAKAGKALGHRSQPIIRQNGNDSALVQFYGDDTFIGVLMPFRMFNEKKPDLGIPTWGADRL